MSRIPEEELFKICLEFWHFFSQNVYDKQRQAQNQNGFSNGNGMVQGMDFGGLINNQQNLLQTGAGLSMMHEAVYPEILHEVKNIMFD